MHPPLPYQLDAPVFVATGRDITSTFDDLVTESDLLAALEEVWQPTGKPKPDFRIAILTDHEPNDTTITGDSPLTMDRRLATQLISHLDRAGFTSSIVIGRDPTNSTTAPFDFQGILRHQPIPLAWRDADFRISFPKCRTNARFFYTGCLSNCAFPPASTPRPRHPNNRRITEEEICILVADQLPVHYGFLDAWLSGDGPDGTHANATQTIFASQNILALDWVAGEKMNLDPSFNPVIREAMLRWGSVAIDRRGNQTAWSPWKNAGKIGALLAGITQT